MNGAIIYKGKYGATRQYAEWLGAELNLPVLTPLQVTEKQWQCDFLLIGTPVYYGKFKIRHWLKRKARQLQAKKLFFFVVNATAPGEQEKRNKFVRDSVSYSIIKQSQFFFLPGRLIHKDLSRFERLVLNMIILLVRDRVKRRALRADIDEVKKEHLQTIIRTIKSLSADTSDIVANMSMRTKPDPGYMI